jgi:ribosomal-protein-alanine N-acetyltransferase
MAPLPPPCLLPPQTPRLLLRDLVPDDAPALFEVFADPTARGLYPAMAERAHVDAWIERNLRRYAEEGFGLWALVLRETGQMVGDRGLTLQDLHGHDALEVGWHVRADLRGRGLATEAGRACLESGLCETDWPRVISLVHVDNAASAAVARKVHAGRLPEAVERRGGSHHVWFTDRLGN